MEGYICDFCKTEKQSGDKVFLVSNRNGGYTACCSNECANQTKSKILREIEIMLGLIRSKEIIEDIW